MISLDDALAGVSRLGLDTAPVIYFVEANPRYDALVTAVFDRIDRGALTGYTSVITLCETLVQPIRSANAALQKEYADLLLNSRHFHTLDITVSAARTAAMLRAQHNLRTPDALQISAAIEAGCDAFFANDRALTRVSGLRVFMLDDLTL